MLRSDIHGSTMVVKAILVLCDELAIRDPQTVRHPSPTRPSVPRDLIELMAIAKASWARCLRVQQIVDWHNLCTRFDIAFHPMLLQVSICIRDAASLQIQMLPRSTFTWIDSDVFRVGLWLDRRWFGFCICSVVIREFVWKWLWFVWGALYFFLKILVFFIYS